MEKSFESSADDTTLIDTSFDVQLDTPSGCDPDALDGSPTLRKYHTFLWSKRLPTGKMFELDISVPRRYLVYHSGSRDFFLTSDAVIQGFTRWNRPTVKAITSQFPPAEHAAFDSIGYTMGGMMIWPGVSERNQPTINQERGCNPKIADRIDLTLECIRRYYQGEESPMDNPKPVLSAYSDFFALFENFRGFTDFFLWQDLVTEDYSAVKFFMPFDNFNGPAIPDNADTYREFRRQSISLVEARNQRIRNWQGSKSA